VHSARRLASVGLVAELLELPERVATGVVAGVLSGTSADGIDVGLLRVRVSERGEPLLERVLASEVVPFEETLARRVRTLLDGGPLALAQLAQLNADLGRAFGGAARQVAAQRGLELALVASHGQTVFHHDGVGACCTLQLGDGDHVAAASGCPVVSDFRQADVARGGEGAPLMPLVDPALFPDVERPCALLNLGGIANLTWVAHGDVRGFDVGPAGALLDGLARRLLDQPYDRDGACAASGSARPDLVEALLAHPFLERTPPKSTGRDTFGPAFVEQFVEAAADAGPAALLASAVQAIARSVGGALERFCPRPPTRLVVAGGGVHNRALFAELAAACPCPVESSALHGIDPDGREAFGFGLLGARFALGWASDLPPVTGARSSAVLGKLSLPADRRAPGER